MTALSRIDVLVQRGSVELSEPVRIIGEMPRHPIEQDRKAGAMAGIDQRREIGRRAEAAGRRKQSGRLITPGAVEGMLGHRHEFDMGEAEVARVGRQHVGELAIAEPAAALLRPAAPRAEMHLVDRDRRAQRVGSGGERRRPADGLEIDDDRSGARPHLGGESHRIGLQRQQLAVGADDLVFVLVSRLDARDEDLPEAVAAHPHGMTAAVPEIEVADHADPTGVGSEHRERDARRAVDHHRMRAELLVETRMRALGEQVEIELGQHRRKSIGVFQLDDAVAETRPDVVARRSVGQAPHEQAGVVDAAEIAFMPLLVDHLDLFGFRKKNPHHRNVAFDMQAEIVEWVGVPTLDHRIGFGRERSHTASASVRERIRQVPSTGTCSQSGRCASSYSIS
jgi:hypothetical protein